MDLVAIGIGIGIGLVISCFAEVIYLIINRRNRDIRKRSNWMLYRNPRYKEETKEEYLNKVLLNQLHNHKVVIRYMVIIILGLTILLIK